MAIHIRRREFTFTLGGAAAAWPLEAHAQQSAMPVIGFLDTRDQDTARDRPNALRRGLKETGYVEGGGKPIARRSAERYPMLEAMPQPMPERPEPAEP
jgi:hypothetical protein